MREIADQEAAAERLEEVAATVERRRKRAEASEQRARQRDAQAEQQTAGRELTAEEVAALPIPQQLAWAHARARHRPMGGGPTVQ